MPFQTTKQTAGSVRFGSGKVEVGDTIGSLVDFGIVNGVTYEETLDVIELEYDNAPPEYRVADQVAAIMGDLVEIELSNLSEFRGGIDSYSTQANSLVSGATQTVTSGNWSFGKFIPIENQNGDGSSITVNSVTGSTDGALAVDDDYYKRQNEEGEWGIIVEADGLNMTVATQDLTIDYDYTPAASKTLTSGGNNEINPKVVRITNTDENGDIFRITLYKAYNQDGISIELQADNAGDFATTSLNLQGVLDNDRTVGDQLVEIYDEQGVV